MKTPRLALALLALGGIGFVIGCGGSDHPATADAAPDAGEDGIPPGGCGSDNAALIALTDYMTPGHAARVDLGTFEVTDNVLALGEDSALRRWGDLVYILNEFGATDADNVQAVAAADLSAVGTQTSTGAGSDPSDLLVASNGKLYVAELEGPGIAVVDLAQGHTTGMIDLSDLDPDGKPNVVALTEHAGKLYAFLALWDDSQMFKPPRGPGRVAIWDLGSGQRVGTFDLQAKNPAGWLRAEPGTANVLVTMVEDYSGSAGGIERVDLDAGISRGLLVTAAALGNRYVSDFLVTPDGSGFVTAVDPASAEGLADLYPFTLAGQVGPSLLSGHPAGLAWNRCGQLWVVERGYGAGAANGVRVFDVSTGTPAELTAEPIVTSLPPRFWGGVVFVP